MTNRVTGFLLLLMVGAFPGIGPLQAFDLVRDGEPQAVIVRNSEGSPRVVAMAARELRDHLHAMTGASLDILRAEAWMAIPEEERPPAIILGHGKATDAFGLSPDDLDPEGFRIRSFPEQNLLVLAGRDHGSPLGTAAPHLRDFEFGTLYAVYEFLEQQGARWYFPGEFGTVLPETDRIEIGEIDLVLAPDFQMRNFWVREQPPISWPEDVREWTGEQGAIYEALEEDLRMWSLRNRAGNSMIYTTRHHKPDWWELWSESHPEYLGLYRGQRGWATRPERSKMCVSNPDAIRALADLAIEAFRESPHRPGYSICEQDGSGGFCECDDCGSWDSGVVSDWSGRPSLSDRYLRFWNEVATLVAEEFPDRHLGVYIYSRYADPPVNIDEMHPMLRGVLVNNWFVQPERYKELVEGWPPLTDTPMTFYVTPYIGAYGMNILSYPWVCLDSFAEGFRYLLDQGLMGFRGPAYAVGNNWIPAAPMHWLTGKLAWNVDLDPRFLLEDFTTTFFGPAADEMQSYFLLLDQWGSAPVSQERAAELAEEGEERTVRNIGFFSDFFTPERRAQLAAYLEEAREAVRQSDLGEEERELFLKRLEPFAASLRYMDLDLLCYERYETFRRDPSDSHWEVFAEAARERRDLLASLQPGSGLIDARAMRVDAPARGLDIDPDQPGLVFHDTFSGGEPRPWRVRAGFDTISHESPSETLSVRGVFTGEEIIIDRSAHIRGGHEYELRIRFLLEENARDLRIRLVLPEGGGNLLSQRLTTTGRWAEDSLRFTAPPDVDRVRVYLYGRSQPDLEGTLFIDEITMQEVSTTPNNQP